MLGGLVLASVVGFSRPSTELELPRLLRTGRFQDGVAAHHLLARQVRTHLKSEKCLVVTDSVTALAAAVIGPSATVLSLGGEFMAVWSSVYNFSVEARDSAIRDAAREQECVVVALAGTFSELGEKLPALDGFRWDTFYQAMHRGGREFGAARLMPEGSDAFVASR